MTEDLTELREKIGDMHSNMFKAMLRLNELPEPLLKRYFVIKAMLDRVDGRLSAADLIRIALDVGLNPETVKFEEKGPMTISRVPTLAEVEAMAKDKGGVIVLNGAAPPEKASPLVEPDDMVSEKADPGPDKTAPVTGYDPNNGKPDTEKPETVVDLTADLEDEENETPPDPGNKDAEPAAEDEPLYPVGTDVKILVGGRILDGKVTEVDGETYSVEADGETHEVPEEDIEG